MFLFKGDVIWDEAEKADRIILEGNVKVNTVYL